MPEGLIAWSVTGLAKNPNCGPLKGLPGDKKGKRQRNERSVPSQETQQTAAGVRKWGESESAPKLYMV